jgi:DNA-binding response OmpR family regulator
MATGKHILVVEDAEDLATVLRDRFRREGYSVETGSLRGAKRWTKS